LRAYNLLLEEPNLAGVFFICVSKEGDVLFSCGANREICKFKRTKDLVFIEEEKEKELETLFEQDLLTTNQKQKKNENEEMIEYSVVEMPFNEFLIHIETPTIKKMSFITDSWQEILEAIS
jgi:hypothetical protein